MTESEWLTTADPTRLLDHVRATASLRRLRLFACACCRAAWDDLPTDSLRQSVMVAERFADDLASEAERDEASLSVYGHITRETEWSAQFRQLAPDDQLRLNTVTIAICRPTGLRSLTRLTGWPVNLRLIPDLMPVFARDIFGNPFRPVTFNPSWRTTTVMMLARRMYDGRDFTPMPILADALQDAGCEHADILAHCRDPHATHVRGCWVVDHVLGLS